jgi:hypothetical protein
MVLSPSSFNKSEEIITADKRAAFLIRSGYSCGSRFKDSEIGAAYVYVSKVAKVYASSSLMNN